ncbi:MAG TPA: ribonuclease III family protein [candidate division Zixibacteria bacterium]|nr:ribonuclease III family protein [candidate division Zixibacteria bacterium]
MKNNDLADELKIKIRSIMRDHALAKFGDTLSNFIYSLAKTKAYSKPKGERVFDKALAEAVRNAKLRFLMPSSSSAGDLGDGAEALIGYAYLNEIISIEEMVELILPLFEEIKEVDFTSKGIERNLMISTFTMLLIEIINRF